MMSITRTFLTTPLRYITHMHPLTKGMVSYAVIWPTSSLIQQTVEGKNLRTYDYMRALRFAIFGSFYVAPSLYCWVRLTSAMWPQTNLRVALFKVAIEQISHGPFATFSFYMGMSLLEGKTIDEAIQEVKNKFLPTFKVGICVWPFLQTINFAMVPERNRVVFTSLCSLVWTSFLAYMKKKDMEASIVMESKTEQNFENKINEDGPHFVESLRTNFLHKNIELNN